MKSKVGHEWYQSLALVLLFRRLFLFLFLKRHHPLKYVKPVLAFNDKKNSFAESTYRPWQIPCTSELILTILSIPVS
jgi:hypothetical protein